MKKQQQKMQLVLIFIGFSLILLTYFYYPYMEKNKLLKDQSAREDLEKTLEDAPLTAFENIEYQGLYDLDKPFSVKSEKAHILDEEPDIVYMTNMNVVLYLKDERIVRIISNRGRYNKATYDCFFEEDVRATDGETKIFSENLDLLATENFVKIYNNVKLNHSTGSLRADKIDYDFETKYFKVSMFDDSVVKMKVIQ
jgi:lipopolysaccharide export system protein LptA